MAKDTPASDDHALPHAPDAMDAAPATTTSKPVQKARTAKASPVPSAAATPAPSAPSFAPRKQREPSSKSMPFLENTATLKSFHAQQVYRRAFEIGNEALFTLSVILRAIADESECVKVDEIVTAKIIELQTAISEERSRLEKLADNYGIQATGLSYSSPQTIAVKVTSPRAVTWLTVIRDLDRLVELFDVLWLSHVIKDGEHSKGIFNSKRKVWRFANDLRTLAIRSMRAAQQSGNDDVQDPRVGTALDSGSPIEPVASPVVADAAPVNEVGAATADEGLKELAEAA